MSENLQREANIFVPGDQISLTIEIEHVQNFSKLYADFARRPEREDDPRPVTSMETERITLQERCPDKRKVSEVKFDHVLAGQDLYPGVYELSRVRGLTVSGQWVSFDVDERLKQVCFQFIPEPTDSTPRAGPVSRRRRG